MKRLGPVDKNIERHRIFKKNIIIRLFVVDPSLTIDYFRYGNGLGSRMTHEERVDNNAVYCRYLISRAEVGSD